MPALRADGDVTFPYAVSVATLVSRSFSAELERRGLVSAVQRILLTRVHNVGRLPGLAVDSSRVTSYEVLGPLRLEFWGVAPVMARVPASVLSKMQRRGSCRTVPQYYASFCCNKLKAADGCMETFLISKYSCYLSFHVGEAARG